MNGELTSATRRQKKSSNLMASPSSSGKNENRICCPTPMMISPSSINEAGKSIAEPSERTQAGSTGDSTALYFGLGETRRGLSREAKRLRRESLDVLVNGAAIFCSDSRNEKRDSSRPHVEFRFKTTGKKLLTRRADRQRRLFSVSYAANYDRPQLAIFMPLTGALKGSCPECQIRRSIARPSGSVVYPRSFGPLALWLDLVAQERHGSIEVMEIEPLRFPG